jgi:hypothetical protein
MDARRVYADELERVAAVYAEAATAVGLRRDAARYLATEGERLAREAKANREYADMLDACRKEVDNVQVRMR